MPIVLIVIGGIAVGIVSYIVNAARKQPLPKRESWSDPDRKGEKLETQAGFLLGAMLLITAVGGLFFFVAGIVQQFG